VNYYKTNYQLMQNFHHSLSDINDMLPWEREIFITLLVEDLKEQQEERDRQARG